MIKWKKSNLNAGHLILLFLIQFVTSIHGFNDNDLIANSSLTTVLLNRNYSNHSSIDDVDSIISTTRSFLSISNIIKQFNKIQSSADLLKSFNITQQQHHSIISTTSTTTTSTTTKLSIAYINNFNITELNYDTKLKTLKLTYLLRANFSTTTNPSSPILFEIAFNCTSPDSDQFWFKSIKDKTTTSLSYLKETMVPNNIQPIPGSLINCSANLVDLNQFKTFHSSKYLLTNPLPVVSLDADSLNETSIELKWSWSVNNSFNLVELKCNTLLDEKIILEIKIHSNLTTSYILNNLIPGTDYVCSITLVKQVSLNLISKSKTISISQMTKLSQAILVENNTNSNDLVEFKIRPPDGNYDYFKFQLIDTNENQTIQTKVFSKEHLFKKQNYTLIHFESEIQPGYAYDLWTETGINTSNNTISFKKCVKLTPIPIIVKPIQITNLIVYALVDGSINVTWRLPLTGRYNKFLIDLYLVDNNKPINSYSTILNFILITNLSITNEYVISVTTSAEIFEDWDVKSSSVNKTFSFKSSKIANFNVKNYNTEQFLSTSSASISLTWNINLTESDRCDLSRFHIFYSDFNKASINDCYTKQLRLIPSMCINYHPINDVLYKECDLFDKLNCFLLNNHLNCSFNMNGFNFNTNYNISIASVSRTGQYEWPVYNSATIHTDTSIPASLKSFQLLSNAQMSSNNMINIIQPYIDESNGPISESYLFLVLLGSADIRQDNSTLNKSYSLDLIDQNYLKNLLEKPKCSNLTDLYEPCLLKKYSSNQNDYRQEKPVFIGSLDNLNSINLTGITYENITSDLILAHSYYQLFYVFKIKNINNQRNSLLFAISPSEPIKTSEFNPTIMNQTFRDGMALWIIIVISITSSLLLLTIITALITLIIIKYKPKSRFRKAAQKVTQPLNHASRSNMKSPIESSSKTTFNDYNGIFMNEFVEPSEFSRNDMTNIWLVKHANVDLILDEEYRNLPDYRHIKTSYASQMSKNEIKNRFLDIKAYDDSRVILDVNTHSNANYLSKQKSQSDTNSQSSVDKSIISSMSTSTSSNTSNELDLNSDYINANFIQGYSHENKFIATQGPKKETISDFWLMIWQYRVTAIVMLTKLVEKGVERCTQYWPDKLNITEVYGEFEITMKDQQKCGDYIKRTFELIFLGKLNITNLTMTPGSTLNKRPLIVTQYYYPEWPDKDTPSTDPMSILHLIRDVNLNHLKYQYPIVVHCSAGVGRTGTYITLDAMMEKINTENKIDIFGFISKIRERRQYLVQTSKQYVFIHEALYEYCLYGFTDVEASRLVSHYKYLNELSPTNVMGIAYQNSTKTRLQIEYEKINNAFVPNNQAREAFSSENKHRNRYLNTICYDENRIKLSGLNGSTYINATKIKGYEPNNEIIVTQDPMFNTLFEFWKLITEYECNIIVSLNKDFEYETESLYWPNQEETIKTFECEDSRFVIQLIKIDESNNQFMTKRELEVTEYKYGTTTKTTVTHFVYNEIWPEDRAPKNRNLFLDFIGQVQKTAASKERSNITVHAHGGGSNCSVFVALIYLLDQFKNDQYVDVCRLVKKMKTQRPHMIETYEQYQFLYQCLVDFADMFGIYSQSSGSFHSRNSLTDSLYRKSPIKQNSTTDVAKLNHIQLNL